MITKEDLDQRRTIIEDSLASCEGLTAEAGRRLSLDLVNEIDRLRRIAISHERMIRELLAMIQEVGKNDPELKGIGDVIDKVANLYFHVHQVS